MEKTPTYDQLCQQINQVNEKTEFYRTLVDNSQDIFYRTDLKGRVTYISPSVYHLTGNTVEEAIGRNMAEDGYLYPEERENFLRKLQKTGRVANFHARMKRKDGSLWWASTNAHFCIDKAGNVIGIEGVTRDISELKTAEEALRKSEARFRLAFHTSPDAINMSSVADGMFIDINEGFTKILGYAREDVIGKTSRDLNLWKDPCDRDYLLDVLLKNGAVENQETEFITKDGNPMTGLVSARIMTLNEEKIILSIIRDITERKKLELQLYQANKLQALGTLAGGIAHNFNNLLMGIAGHASLIPRDLEAGNSLKERVAGIEECVRSAADLTKQLLGLARGGKYELKPIDMNKLMVKSAKIFGRTRKEIQIHTKLHGGKVAVKVDGNQIEQVLLNLFVNAWQAMPAGGHLYLETSIALLDEGDCRSRQINPGRYCKISVADTGMGMDEETRLCVFDPFFTTKENECGTGLGLASVYGIVKNHGGVVEVESEMNCGTTFTIFLPLSSEDPVKEEKTEEDFARGSETILLVDDEAMLLKVATSMLETLGYRVVVSDNGPGAIDTVTKQGDIIDLVILDLIMPGMDGGKTFDHIRSLRSDMPVILSSGYSLNGQAQEILNKGCSGFIQKPFNLSKLSQKVRQVLDAVGGKSVLW